MSEIQVHAVFPDQEKKGSVNKTGRKPTCKYMRRHGKGDGTLQKTRMRVNYYKIVFIFDNFTIHTLLFFV